jgi:hypothetical protein
MKGCKTGGRIKGTPNKATVEIKELARRYALTAVRELAGRVGLLHGTARWSVVVGEVSDFPPAIREACKKGL